MSVPFIGKIESVLELRTKGGYAQVYDILSDLRSRVGNEHVRVSVNSNKRAQHKDDIQAFTEHRFAPLTPG